MIHPFQFHCSPFQRSDDAHGQSELQTLVVVTDRYGKVLHKFLSRNPGIAALGPDVPTGSIFWLSANKKPLPDLGASDKIISLHITHNTRFQSSSENPHDHHRPFVDKRFSGTVKQLADKPS